MTAKTKKEKDNRADVRPRDGNLNSKEHTGISQAGKIYETKRATHGGAA